LPPHADTAGPAPHLLHIFATFCAGGPQMRTAAILNRLGSEFRHTILPMDGDFAARTRIDPSVPHTLLPPPARQSSLRYPRTMRRLIGGLAPDLVLTYNWGSMDAFVGAATLPGLPVVHTEDGFGRDEAVRLLPRRVWTRRIWLRFAHRVVVPSQTLLRIALGSYKLPRSKVTFIANGIDTDRFTPATNPAKRAELGIPADALVFGFIGRLSPEKNLPLLLESFAAARLPNARLLIVGEGECGPQLRQQASALGIAGSVIFNGPTVNTLDYYRAIDVFTMSSKTEQAPMSLLEAMGCALPALCTDVGDLKAMLGPTGASTIVPADNPAAYTDALGRLAGDAGLRRHLGQANRARCIEHYSLDRMITSYRALYRSALRS